jgi:hypothetical protein
VKLAEAYLNVGRVDDARRVIDALLATRWRTADAHAAAARVYARSGDGARAAVERRAALAIDPHALDDEPDAGPSLAKAYAMEVMQTIKEILKLNPFFKEQMQVHALRVPSKCLPSALRVPSACLPSAFCVPSDRPSRRAHACR